VGNALAITLFCLDHAYASRGRDFLPFAFEQFVEKDYLLLTLPSTCTPPPILTAFTLVKPKPASTLSHVLYILHRDTLLATSHLRYEETNGRLPVPYHMKDSPPFSPPAK
jgi:hypothetical protein